MTEQRKRKSFWDIEEEVKHPSGVNEHNSWSGKEQKSNIGDGRYHGFSAPGATFIPKFTDNSRRPAWESADENPTTLISGAFIKTRHDAPEAKEVDRYFKTMSPGFDGMKKHNHNNSFEDDRSHSHRCPVRVRSRSRGRACGRSRSRSLSRGREMECGRSRSRSRSRSNGNVRDQTSSRSPKESYRRQSYGWSDRNRGPHKVTQICRDFSGPGCRRGSQCRFLHPNPNNSSHKSGNNLDKATENWRNRPDHSRLSKHDHGTGSEFETQDRVSDSRHGKDEQSTRKNRNSFPCKDFMRGNCRWADSCEFSHHDTSGNSFDKASIERSFSKDSMQQLNLHGKPICKFFVAGKCDRNNCKFSHEDQKSDSPEATGTKVNDQCCLRDKVSWSGNAMRASDAVRTIGWGDTPVTDASSAIGWNDIPVTDTSSTIGWNNISVTKTSSAADTTKGISWSTESEKNLWGIHVRGDKSYGEKQSSPTNESGSHDRDIRPIESFGKNNVLNKQEQLIHFGTHFQSRYEILKAQQQPAFQEDSCLSVKTLQQNAPSASQIQQQHHKIVENNPLNQFASGVVEGMEGSQNSTTCALHFSEQKLNRNGGSILFGPSSISNETNREQNMIYSIPSNEILMDLDVSKEMIINSQDRIPKVQRAINSPERVDSKVLQIFPRLNGDREAQLTKPPAIIPDRQVTPLTENPTTFLAQRCVNEQAQTYQSGIVSKSNGIATSFSDTSVHAENNQLNPATISINLFNPMDDGGDPNGCNYHFIPVSEHNSQIHTNLSPPISGDGNTTIVKDPGNEELKHEEKSVKAEDKAHGEESREVINVSSKTQDDNGNVEERNTTKDEKVIRVFKNALIEFVKEILKPIWKEGRMSREVHKTVVKKVSDKITSTIPVDHIPKTQDKVQHYLSCSKPKITKLVQAYVDRCRKTES